MRAKNRIRKEVLPVLNIYEDPNLFHLVLNSIDTSLTVYQGENPSKNVLLLSSLHKSVVCSDNRKKTPASIAYCNKAKYGVDVLDQNARIYKIEVHSKRWPLKVFNNILYLSVINSVIK